MVVKVFKCQMCGTRFEATVFDQDDPHERQRPGARVHCPNPRCNSTRIEEVQSLRRMRSAG